jgi:glycosyltransferase involved in cell wall biosynthesis
MANINDHAQNQPLVTIGMTSFNARDTIARALDSALAQDWPNLEIVVVDDGSNDDSVAVINEKIHGRDNCRLIVHGRNRGFPAALNSVVGAARGEFLAIWDDDDESRTDRLSVQYRTIVEYEKLAGTDLVACYASGLRLYPNGYTIPFEAIGSRPEVPVGMCVADYHLFGARIGGVFYGAGTPSCSLMVRTSTLAAVGSYDETLRRCEDSDFAIRLARREGHFVGCGEQLIRQFATGGSDKKPDVEYDSHVALIEKYREYLIGINRYRYALDWQKIKFYHFSRKRVRAFVALAGLAMRHPAWTIAQFRRSAPARLVHERRMSR